MGRPVSVEEAAISFAERICHIDFDRPLRTIDGMIEEPTLVVAKPADLKPMDFDSVVALVQAGGQLALGSVVFNLRRAAWIAIVHLGQTLVATASIKNPDEDYRDAVFAKAATRDIARAFHFELGYVVTRTGYEGRHYASDAADAALAHIGDDGIYATSNLMGEHMQRLLENRGFRTSGKAYNAANPGERLLLFVR